MSTAASVPCFHGPVRQAGEEVAVQVVHGVVVVLELGGGVDVLGRR